MKSRAGILAALRVMCGGSRQRLVTARGPFLHAAVEACKVACCMGRIAADFVQRKEAVVAVEKRVLDALRHSRARKLLEPIAGKSCCFRVCCPSFAFEEGSNACDGLGKVRLSLTGLSSCRIKHGAVALVHRLARPISPIDRHGG